MTSSKPRQSPDGDSIATEFEKLGDKVSNMMGPERTRELESLVRVMKANCPGETLARLMSFADSYFRPAPWEFRRRLWISRREEEMAASVADPFYLVLGDPASPIPCLWDFLDHSPCQEDFDRIAADWLRKVIIQKDIPKLNHLIEALRKLPPEMKLAVGMDVGSIARALNQPPSEFTSAGPAHDQFSEMFRDHQKLPTKKELRLAINEKNKKALGQNARDIDMANWTKTLKSLGLQGLPEDEKRDTAF